MIIDHVHDHGEAALVGLLDEELVLVATAAAVLDGAEMRGRVSPILAAAAEFGHGQKFDRVHACRGDLVEQCNGVLESAGPRRAEAESAGVKLVDDEVLDA